MSGRLNSLDLLDQMDTFVQSESEHFRFPDVQRR